MQKILVKEVIEMLVNGKIENMNNIYFEVDGCYFYTDEIYLLEDVVKFHNNNYDEGQRYGFDEYIYIEEK